MKVTYRNEVSHRVARRVALRNLRAGRVRRSQVCDADAILVSAAEFHGRRVGRPCPVCGGEELAEVRFVYGDTLGSRSGTARSEQEIATIVAEAAARPVPAGKDGLVMVHLVEVCPACRWNHLLSTGVAALA